jgi:hypothetical protein
LQRFEHLLEEAPSRDMSDPSDAAPSTRIAAGAVMDFSESSEDRMPRDAVHGIASSYGHGWYVERARAGGRATELWDDLARKGYLGVNIPRSTAAAAWE